MTGVLIMRRTLTVTGLIFVMLLICACSATPESQTEKATLSADVAAAKARFMEEDPDMEKTFRDAYGYAIFPTIGKGAVGIGGAYGRGLVFEKGRKIGYCDMSQGTIGLQLGGQAYSEVILFEDKGALDNFTSGEFEFSAQASAVAATAGASTTADYSDGVMVFTIAKGGLMYEASIGGQKFDYEPK